MQEESYMFAPKKYWFQKIFPHYLIWQAFECKAKIVLLHVIVTDVG